MLSPLQIRKGSEEYLLCWRLDDCSSPLRFYDETEALYFLRSVITDSGLMHDLRTWLLSENHSSVMYAIADDDVMGHIARMLASGEIAAATMEIGEGEGEGAGLGEEEGILRKSGVFAATPSTATETTPRQDEVARREQTAVEPEEIVPAKEEAEEPEETPLVAEVHAELPPELAPAAEVEAHPAFPTEAEAGGQQVLAAEATVDEEAPTLAAEAETGEEHGLETETAVEQAPVLTLEAEIAKEHGVATETETAAKEPPTVGAEAEAGEQHVLETDTAVERRPPSKISTETTTGEPPAVDTGTDVHKPPAVRTDIDVHHDKDGDDKD